MSIIKRYLGNPILTRACTAAENRCRHASNHLPRRLFIKIRHFESPSLIDIRDLLRELEKTGTNQE